MVNHYRVWLINITDQFIAIGITVSAVVDWEFWYCSSIRLFAIPTINSALKQKTANYSATHRQQDNKATYKQICKSYSRLANTLLGDTATERDDTLSAPQSSLSLSLFSSPTPFSFFVFFLLSFPAYLTCNQACRLMHTVVFSFSVPLCLCLSVCLSCWNYSE